MTFRITGIDPNALAHYVGRSEQRLKALGAERHLISEPNAAPCRISLVDALPGETVILLRWQHQGADTPYQQTGPIFIREGTQQPFNEIDTLPPALLGRFLSVRAYDKNGTMIDADIIEGPALPTLIARFWQNPDIAEAHAHFARRGCFAARIHRA